jgi:hypothetical protein
VSSLAVGWSTTVKSDPFGTRLAGLGSRWANSPDGRADREVQGASCLAHGNAVGNNARPEGRRGVEHDLLAVHHVKRSRVAGAAEVVLAGGDHVLVADVGGEEDKVAAALKASTLQLCLGIVGEQALVPVDADHRALEPHAQGLQERLTRATAKVDKGGRWTWHADHFAEDVLGDGVKVGSVAGVQAVPHPCCERLSILPASKHNVGHVAQGAEYTS